MLDMIDPVDFDFLGSGTNLIQSTKNDENIIIQLTQEEAEKFRTNKENQQTQNALDSRVKSNVVTKKLF